MATDPYVLDAITLLDHQEIASVLVNAEREAERYRAIGDTPRALCMEAFACLTEMALLVKAREKRTAVSNPPLPAVPA